MNCHLLYTIRLQSNKYQKNIICENERLLCHFVQVVDDVVECETIKEENCEDLVAGYTSEQKCAVWPKEVKKGVYFIQS